MKDCPSFLLKDINERLADIDDRLYVLRSRGGDYMYRYYDTKTGYPTTTEAMYIVYRGEGHCSILDGGVLPMSGLHLLENGWGITVVQVFPRTTDEAFSVRLEAAAAYLATEAIKRIPYGKLQKWQLTMRSRLQRFKLKLAAFRAA